MAHRFSRNRFSRNAYLAVAATLLLSAAAVAADVHARTPSLDHGFQLLYNLNFPDAHREFLTWQQQHPDDPVGCIGDAAGLLFSEFNRLGILEAQFFEDDHIFQQKKKQMEQPSLFVRVEVTVYSLQVTKELM